jgi:hypothetical protein
MQDSGRSVRQTYAMKRGDSDSTTRVRSLALFALALLLLIAFAATLPRGLALSRRAARDTVVVPDLPLVAVFVLLAIVVALLAFAALLHGIRPRHLALKPVRRAPVWVQIVIVLMSILLASQITNSERFTNLFQIGSEEESATRGERGGGSKGGRRGSEALGLAVTILLVLVLGGIVAAMIWVFREEGARGADARGPTDSSELFEELAAGLDDLGSIADPRRAVIACYAHMERILGEAGVARRASDTPLEFLARVPEHHRAAEASLQRLTELFERAKFSPHQIDESMRASASRALIELRDHIHAGVPERESEPN